MADAKNRERGLRAAINNPRVSEQAKQHDRELLASEFGEQLQENPPQTHAQRRASSSKKSSSTGPHAATSEEPQKSTSTAADTAQPTARKGRRASSGDATSLEQMTEEKGKANV